MKHSSMDLVIDTYKKDIDRSLIRENLKLTVEQRLLKLQGFMKSRQELGQAGRNINSISELESILEERQKS